MIILNKATRSVVFKIRAQCHRKVKVRLALEELLFIIPGQLLYMQHSIAFKVIKLKKQSSLSRVLFTFS